MYLQAGYSAVMLGSLKEVISPKDTVVLKRLFENGNLNCIAQSVSLNQSRPFSMKKKATYIHWGVKSMSTFLALGLNYKI